MVSKPVANSMVVLRIVALVASVATVAVMATNSVKFGGIKTKFQDLVSYRYVLAVAVIAAAYGVVQLPFAVYYVVKQTRLIGNVFLREFDFYGDKVISLLLATGIAVGFAVSLEFKKFIDELFVAAGVLKKSPGRSANDKFLNRGIIASAVLSVAFLANRAKSRDILK